MTVDDLHDYLDDFDGDQLVIVRRYDGEEMTDYHVVAVMDQDDSDLGPGEVVGLTIEE